MGSSNERWYEVTILSQEAIDAWHVPIPGWEPFANEHLIVGWQRNLTKSPGKRRPIRKIAQVVDNYYQRDLTTADYRGFGY